MKSYFDFLNEKYRIFIYVPRWVALIFFYFFFVFFGSSLQYSAALTIGLSFFWFVYNQMRKAKTKKQTDL